LSSQAPVRRTFFADVPSYAVQMLHRHLPHDVLAAEDPKKNKPKWCREAYAHSDSVAIKDAMLKADVIVFDIVHAQKEATAALKILLKAEYEEEKTLIAVSSILSWADTPAPKPAEDDEPVEEVAGEEAVEGQPPPKAPEPAGPAITYVHHLPAVCFCNTLARYKHVAQRRPHSSLRALQTTENLILQKGNVPKDQLRTYVVWPGVLYVFISFLHYFFVTV
jgi:hypothetical protein